MSAPQRNAPARSGIDWGAVLTDPLVLDRLRRQREYNLLGHAGGLPVSTAGEVLASRAMTAVGVAGIFDDATEDQLGASFVVIPGTREERLALAGAILTAIPYWWTNDVDALISSLPLPKHIVAAQELPAPAMYIEFEGAHNDIDSLLLRQQADGIAVYYIGGPAGGVGLHAELIEFGKRYPEDFAPELFAVQVLKFLAFIASPYTETVPKRLSRGERKALARAGREEPVVHVIQLRAEARQAVDEYATAAGSGCTYRHRFWVRGHYRAQWYPSLGAHKVIWIAPHLKGPGDKPFKAPVYAVTR